MQSIKTIFLDWNGTISKDYFWESLRMKNNELFEKIYGEKIPSGYMPFRKKLDTFLSSVKLKNPPKSSGDLINYE